MCGKIGWFLCSQGIGYKQGHPRDSCEYVGLGMGRRKPGLLYVHLSPPLGGAGAQMIMESWNEMDLKGSD